MSFAYSPAAVSVGSAELSDSSTIDVATPRGTLSDLYVHSRSSNPPLRVGLLLDGPYLMRAFASVLDDLARSNFARVELVVYNGATEAAPAPAATSTIQRVKRWVTNPYTLWGVYNRLDQRLFGVDNDPLAPEDCRMLLDGIESLTVEPITRGFVHRFPPQAIEQIRAANLDVLIRFGFNILRGEILSAARYGVWSFHHGDNDQYRGGPAHFWELQERQPLSGVILQVLTEDLDAGRVLAKALFPTELSVSLVRNRVCPYWGSTHLMLQKLWELHNYGWAFVEGRMLPPAPYRGRQKIYRRPRNGQVARWVAREAIKKGARFVTRVATRGGDFSYWQIATRMDGNIVSADGTPNLQGFTWIPSPPGHYYADPFVIERDGRHWVFVEDYVAAKGRGVISCAEIGPDGKLGPAQTVLDTGDHLSFPHVFADGNTLYMIPESARARAVRLYKCDRFPDQWVPVTDLFAGVARDTAVCRHDGRWWFFTTLVDPRGHGGALYLFYADTLQGRWHYHPANPISFDARFARSAGRVFESDGKLIRPSQDARYRYGYAFGLNEIVTLTPTEYEERPIFTVEPHWFPGFRGCHTYNRAGRVEVIDGQTLRRRDGF